MPQQVDEAGNIWDTDANGNLVYIGNVNQQQQPPADPTFQYEGPQAQATLERTQTQNQVDKALLPYQIQKAQADAEKAQADASKVNRESQRPQLSPKEYSDAINAYYAAANLDSVIADIEQRYKEGPGSTSGLAGIQDYLPTPQNERFNKAGSAARGPAIAALNFSATQMNTPAEAEQNIGAYIPKASQYDATIQDTIDRLKELQKRTLNSTVATLGGIPDRNGNITPIEKVPESSLPNALRTARFTGADRLLAAPFGSDKGVGQIPPEMQQDFRNFVAQGNFTPEQYAAFRAKLDSEYGFDLPQGKMDEYRAEGSDVLKVLQNGGEIPDIPAPERDLSTTEILRNSMANNPAGAAAIGAGNMGGFGAVQALAPDQYAALREARPNSTTLGEILGAVGATSGLGAVGRGTVGRVVPRVLQGDAAAQMARNLATDTAYGAAYGGITEGDPVTGGALGAIGSGLGQGAGRLVGGVVRGAGTDPAVRTLLDRGIPLTGGQVLGGPMKAIEDRLMSAPVLGDIIRNRRIEGMQGFNQAAFSDAGAPINARVTATGREGLQQLGDATSQAYDAATAGQQVNLDPQIAADIRAAMQQADNLPPDLRQRFELALQNRVAPALDTGTMTGEGYQQAVRGLKGYRAETPKPGFEGDYRDRLRQVEDALTAQMQRGGSPETVSRLAQANEAYRYSKTLKDALDRGIGGTQSGEVGLFTPSQLQQAGKASERKFGSRPFQELADAGQAVLPSKIPDSGTAGRLAQLALPGALAGSGAGVGYAAGDAQSGAATGLTLGALLAALGTRQGQNVIRSLLTVRPDSARTLGNIISNNSGVIGSGTVPLVIAR